MITARKRLALSIGKRFKAWELEAIGLIEASQADLIGWTSAVHEPEHVRGLPSRAVRDVEGDHLFESSDPARQLQLRPIDWNDATEADVILHLGGSWPRPGSSAGQPAQWVFRHADGAPLSDYPPGLREWLLAFPHAGMQLIDAATGSLLRECRIPIGHPATTAIEMIEWAKRWPHDTLREEAASAGPIERQPAETLPRMANPGLMHLLRRRWRDRLGGQASPYMDHSGPWNIGVLYQPIHVLLQEDGSRNVRWLPNPSKGKSRMEPFGYLDQDGDLNALYRKGNEDGSGGLIARVRPKADNILKRSKVMLDGLPDAAYPFVLQLQGAPHALVADRVGRTTRLCPVMANNEGLEPGNVILPEALHAPTLFQCQGRWWLFGTRDPLPEAELWAWHSGSPWGPFEPHAQAPLKCDVRNARPAGTPFLHEGSLYRPTLDSSDPKHLALWINRVALLTPEVFLEFPVRRITGFEASSYGLGIRTICAMGDVTLVDGHRSPVMDAHRANANRGKSGRTKKKRS